MTKEELAAHKTIVEACEHIHTEPLTQKIYYRSVRCLDCRATIAYVATWKLSAIYPIS